jgi:hypothetical protein
VSEIPLTRVAGRVQEQTGIVVPGAYRRLYAAVLDGRLPAVKGSDGRYMVRSDHLPCAVDVLSQLPGWAERRVALRQKQTA